MQTYLLDMLACPACHGELEWNITRQADDRIEEAETRCKACARLYPVREGIGVFLLDEIQRNDLWEQAESALMKYLRAQPELYDRLMTPPLESLSPADQFLRCLLLEEQGDFAGARPAHAAAMSGLYLPEYLSCSQRQLDYVTDCLAAGAGPIVDLASGRGYLVEQMAARLKSPIVGTDFSLQVLRQDRKRWQLAAWYERVSLLAFDARRTPFKDQAVRTLTTNLGLPNIQDPGALLNELRRAVSGSFLAISHFFPEDDSGNRAEIEKLNLGTFMYRRSTLESFSNAGWQVKLENVCTSRAAPTAPSTILEGMRIDSLPVGETELEWCVVNGNW